MLPPGRYDRVVVAGDHAETLRDRCRVTSQAELKDRLIDALQEAGCPRSRPWRPPR